MRNVVVAALVVALVNFALPATPASAANWDTIQGQWKQFTGKAKERWGKLTDNEITEINGRREQLEGKLQERYGYTKEQVKKEVDDWLDQL